MLSWSLLCASNFFDGINFEPSARKWWSMNNIFDTIFSNNPLEKGSDFFFHSKQESFPPNFFVFNQSCLLITQGKKLGKEKHSLKKKSRWNLGQTQFFFSAFNFSLLFLLYFFFVVLVKQRRQTREAPFCSRYRITKLQHFPEKLNCRYRHFIFFSDKFFFFNVRWNYTFCLFCSETYSAICIRAEKASEAGGEPQLSCIFPSEIADTELYLLTWKLKQSNKQTSGQVLRNYLHTSIINYVAQLYWSLRVVHIFFSRQGACSTCSYFIASILNISLLRLTSKCFPLLQEHMNRISA